MRKLFLTFAVVFLAVAANAQVWMGGSFGFNSTKATKNADPIYSYSIAPEVGYTFADGWDVAVALGYAGSYTKNVTTLPILGDVTTTGTVSQYSVEPYVRYTAFELGNVGFFLDCGGKYSYSKENVTVGSTSTAETTNSYWVGIQPGVKFAASDKITVAARIGSLGYGATKNGMSSFGLNVDNSAFTLGLWWTL